MEIFYGKYNSKPTNAKRVFGEHFPHIFDIVNDLKAYMHRNFTSLSDNPICRGCIYSKEKKDKTDYHAGNSCLPILLMNIESHIFVDRILNELHSVGFNVITKHDSILVKESDHELVLSMVKDVLNEQLGVDRYKLKSG